MKILITEPEYFPKKIIEELGEIGDVVAERMDRDRLEKEIEDADFVLVRVETRLDRKILEKSKKLKFIGSMTTGLDHIDIEVAKEMGIEVVNFPGYATTSTAEYTMAIILSLIRKLPWAFENLKKDKWERYRFLGAELNGKTLGIIGFGRIGSTVAKYAKAFGMKIIFFDPYVHPEALKEVEATRVDSVDEILRQSDVITLHTFLSDETRGMFNKDAFSKMKRNVILVNASRGEVINDADLIEALGSGKIAAAGLDVFSQEPIPSSHPLVKYAKENENLFLSPHMAGSTRESTYSAARFMAEKIKEISGNTPRNKNITRQT